ncbi:MAG TPA: energy transducer TonB, partial [Sphingomicrobium sp.]|nr:energy transducer TonB [Sphingomicrobium sp.]
FDDQDPIAVNALAYGDRAAKRVLAAINLPMERFAAHRQAGSVEIKAGAFDERLAVPGLGTVLAAFDDCLASLRAAWNVGEPHRSRLSRAARPMRELSDLFRSTKYPAQAMRQGETGRVGVAMLVDETGKVADCMVEETSGYATLDSMSCYVIATEARFEPAAGVDGKPVRSAYFQRINWRIKT